MWKVIIADDEEIIREGIREAVNWDEFQMEVVAEAEDGEEALELELH
jgi:two-component system response regulator YesN